MQQRQQQQGLTEVVRDNTRAMTALEVGQRELTNAIQHIAHPQNHPQSHSQNHNQQPGQRAS